MNAEQLRAAFERLDARTAEIAELAGALRTKVAAVERELAGIPQVRPVTVQLTPLLGYLVLEQRREVWWLPRARWRLLYRYGPEENHAVPLAELKSVWLLARAVEALPRLVDKAHEDAARELDLLCRAHREIDNVREGLRQ